MVALTPLELALETRVEPQPVAPIVRVHGHGPQFAAFVEHRHVDRVAGAGVFPDRLQEASHIFDRRTADVDDKVAGLDAGRFGGAVGRYSVDENASA